MAYVTVAKKHMRLETIKGSRFFALVFPIASLDDVENELESTRMTYPDANHYCYAYKIGQNLKFSDDGEPGGTAGRPMLEVLQKRNLEAVLGIVVRYFGGTKLGAGGLVRAYSGSLAKALDEAGETLIKDRTKLFFEIPFQAMDSVHRYLSEVAELVKEEMSYTAEGLRLGIDLLLEDEAQVKKDLLNLSKGDVRWLEP